MKLDHISFTPVAAVNFTESEIEVMLLCSAAHYDGRCKEAGQPGGFLFGIKNRSVYAPESPNRMEWRDLDTLSKILEVGGYLSPEKKVIAATVQDEIVATLKEMSETQPASRAYPQNDKALALPERNKTPTP